MQNSGNMIRRSIHVAATAGQPPSGAEYVGQAADGLIHLVLESDSCPLPATLPGSILAKFINMHCHDSNGELVRVEGVVHVYVDEQGNCTMTAEATPHVVLSGDIPGSTITDGVLPIRTAFPFNPYPYSILATEEEHIPRETEDPLDGIRSEWRGLSYEPRNHRLMLTFDVTCHSENSNVRGTHRVTLMVFGDTFAPLHRAVPQGHRHNTLRSAGSISYRIFRHCPTATYKRLRNIAKQTSNQMVSQMVYQS